MEQPETSQRNNEDRAQQCDEDLPIWEYASQRRVGDQSCIKRPPIHVDDFEIKSSTISFLNNVQFFGLSSEDPNLHVSNFLEVCDMCKYSGVSDDAIRLRLFPWTLKDKAKMWLNSLPAGSITTWEEMEAQFLNKFFPPTKTFKLKNDICNFYQWDQETLYEAWERFKELLRKCPNHGFQLWMQVELFYNGLVFNSKQVLDAAAGGAIMKKKAKEAFQLIEDMAMSAYQFPFERRSNQRSQERAINQIDVESLSSQIASRVLTTIGQSVEKGVNPNLANVSKISLYDYCGASNHYSEDCQLRMSKSNFVGDFQGKQHNNVNTNKHELGWRSYPNPLWAEEDEQEEQCNGIQEPNQFHGLNQSKTFDNPIFSNSSSTFVEPKMSKLEEAMAEMMKVHSSFVQNSQLRFDSTHEAIRRLEAKVSELAKERSKSKEIPSIQPEEISTFQVQAIQLRSGTHYDGPKEPKQVEVEAEVEKEKQHEEDQTETSNEQDEVDIAEPQPQSQDEAMKPQISKYIPPHAREAESSSKQKEVMQSDPKKKEAENMPTKMTKPSPPFPSRFKNAKLDNQFKKFLDIFKQLHVNIPFIDALEKMPNYKRFLKEMMKSKREWDKKEMVSLNEECSAIFQNKLPPKLGDPGSFSIPCFIGDIKFVNCLCDLGASINLMPYNVFVKLGIGDLKPTNITLQMADHSLKKPLGVLEDVIVKIDKFLFPMDFVVLGMDDDEAMPLIFGRPFLATSRAKIDVQEGRLTLRVGKEKVTFNNFKPIQYPKEEWCHEIKIFDEKLVDKGKKWIGQHGKSLLKNCFGSGSNHHLEPG